MRNQNARILLVDDESTIRLTLGALLERTGYDVTSAESGEQAEHLLEQERFDLLLTDLKMPGLDGMQVVAAARQCQPDVAIIVLTGHGSLETAIQGLHQHIFDYMLKTSTPVQVLARVEAGLAARAQEQRQQQLIDVVGSALNELRGEWPVDHAGQPGGSATGRRDRAQFFVQPDAVGDAAGVRRVHEREVGHLAEIERGRLQDDRGQVGAEDLRVGELRP